MNTLKHIAFIMDGNGRWGKKRNKGRNFGHSKGLENLKNIIKKIVNLKKEFSKCFSKSYLVIFGLFKAFPNISDLIISVDCPEGYDLGKTLVIKSNFFFLFANKIALLIIL